MNKAFVLGIGILLAGYMLANARPSHTGHLYVTLTDRETGGPITNAMVTVRTQTQFNIGRTLESDFTKTSAQTDANGVAHVQFQFYDDDFDWWVDAPSHFNGRHGSGYGQEHFRSVVAESDYANIDTNTVEGLAKYNELSRLYSTDYMAYAAKFNPRSIAYPSNVVCRSVCLTPKHNPLPMYAYDGYAGDFLPMKNPAVVITNGLEVLKYKTVDFDMKDNLRLSTKPNYIRGWDPPAGHVSDFRIERFALHTNGVETLFGWIEFAPGCGAYKRNTTGDPSFPTTYEADTNETFVSRIPFEYSSVSGKVVYAQSILGESEYMVLKTRVVTNAVGEVTSCNYSKILGPVFIDNRLWFKYMVFNPRPNDPNLEFDMENNLATGRPCYLYP